MNGATTEPCVRTTSPPNRKSVSSIGRSQNFFLTTRNDQNSFIKLMAPQNGCLMLTFGSIGSLFIQ